MNVEGLYGGGFYKLLNIRESEQTQAFYDIYLLAETVKDIDLLKKVKDLNDLSAGAPLKPQKTEQQQAERLVTSEKKQVFFKDIKNAITGHARIIKYINHSVINVVEADHMAESG